MKNIVYILIILLLAGCSAGDEQFLGSYSTRKPEGKVDWTVFKEGDKYFARYEGQSNDEAEELVSKNSTQIMNDLLKGNAPKDVQIKLFETIGNGLGSDGFVIANMSDRESFNTLVKEMGGGFESVLAADYLIIYPNTRSGVPFKNAFKID